MLLTSMSITGTERMKPNADPREIDSFLPLQPYEFQALMVLSEEERHGYGIRRATLERTDGKLRLDPGVLYRTLRRLQEAGLIAESARRPAADLDDQRRRYYRLTELGRRVAAAEAERLEDLIVMARKGDLLHDREGA
jgi:DNA-binding PadR family transcriptional regulator